MNDFAGLPYEEATGGTAGPEIQWVPQWTQPAPTTFTSTYAPSPTVLQQIWLDAYHRAPPEVEPAKYADRCLEDFRERFPGVLF